MADKVNPLLEYYSKLTPEERREQCARGGKAGAAGKRRYQTQRELLKNIMVLDIDDPEVAEHLRALGLPPTFGQAIALAQSVKAAKTADGDAARYCRDTLGERPTESYNVGITPGQVKDTDLSTVSTEELQRLVAEMVANTQE